MNKIKKYYPIITIGIISFIISVFLLYLGAFSLIEIKLYDLKFRLRGPLDKKDKDIVLVEIDDHSYDIIPESYPYPREKVWARVVDNLTAAGAKVIVFDIQFDSKDHYTQSLHKIDTSLCQTCSTYNGDSIFNESIFNAKNNGTEVILAAKLTIVGHDSTVIVKPTSSIMESNPIIALVDQEVDLDNINRRYPIFFNTADSSYTRLYTLAVQTALSYLDLDNGKFDFDDKNKVFKVGGLDIESYRDEAAFLINYYGPESNNNYPTFDTYSLSMILADGIFELDVTQLDDIQRNMYESYAGLFINTQMGKPSKILLDSIDNPITKQILLDNFDGDNSNSVFKDKIVIIGTSLQEDHDFNQTPFFIYSGNLHKDYWNPTKDKVFLTEEYPMPGIEFHANAIQQLIDGTYIQIPTKTLDLSVHSWPYQIPMLIFIVCLILFISHRTSIIIGAILTLLSMFIWFSVSMGLFINDQFWLFNYIFDSISAPTADDTLIMLPVFFPIATMFITYGVDLCYKLVIEQKDKRFLKDTFGRYVAPELIDQMYDNKKLPELGGESGIRTAFFSDIESFSKISSQLTAVQLVELLNEFLSDQTDIILNRHGTLDKYEGDAILAFFGAPIFFENHAEQALSAGVELFLNLESLKIKWRKEGEKWPSIVHNMNMRIGINTGEMVTGNMGSKQHMNYTMMGEVVNLAARLESGAKLYGVYFLTTYDTLKDAGIEKYAWRYIDRTVFIGFDKWYQTVEILGFKNKIPKEEKLLIENFQLGLQAYYNREWDKASLLFEKSKKYETIRHEEDINPSGIFIERIKLFRENPPDKFWDGSHKLEEK